MKINQVIDVKPTRSEKEFLRSVLAKVATADKAPLNVAEKIEFGEVKHITEYASFVDYSEEIEYSAIIGHKTEVRKGSYYSGSTYEYIQWQNEPYYGKATFDKVDIKLLDCKDSDERLRFWNYIDSTWAEGFLKNKENKLSTETLNEEVEVQTEEQDLSAEYPDDPEWQDIKLYAEAYQDAFAKWDLEDVMPGDDQKDVKILNVKRENGNVKVYKLHSYEVSYTYEGRTYYAKARAIKECDEVLLASDENNPYPHGFDLYDALEAKEKPFVILAHASWILTYASALVSLISSKLWYIPVIFMALAFVVTKVCNFICDKLSEKIKDEYNSTHITTIITASLRRGIEKLDLGELSEEEAYKVGRTIENSEIKYPVSSEVTIGLKLGISIAATIVLYIVSVAIEVL